MNSTINSVLPLASLNLKVPIKANQQTNSGFGSVLRSAMGAELSIQSDMAAITEGRMSVIKDLLVFLKLERLSDKGEENAAVAPTVNQRDNKHILQVLTNVAGNDEDALADFLTSIEELDLEQEVDDFSLNPQSLLSADVMELYTILKKLLH